MAKNLWKWLKENDKQLQLIVVVILIFITIFYAFSTHKMASTMSEEFELSNRPFLAISEIISSLDNQGNLIISFRIKNVGKLPGEIFKFESAASMKKSQNESFLIYPEMINMIPSFYITKDKLNEEGVINEKIYYTAPLTYDKIYCVEYNIKYWGDPNLPLAIINSTICE